MLRMLPLESSMLVQVQAVSTSAVLCKYLISTIPIPSLIIKHSSLASQLQAIENDISICLVEPLRSKVCYYSTTDLISISLESVD